MTRGALAASLVYVSACAPSASPARPIPSRRADTTRTTTSVVDAENAAITSAIVALGHSLRLEIVAEGVETEAEEEFLHSLGCYLVQGFRFAQPMSPSEFVEWRRARPWA